MIKFTFQCQYTDTFGPIGPIDFTGSLGSHYENVVRLLRFSRIILV